MSLQQGALVAVILLIASSATAKVIDLGNHTADEVKAKCGQLKGTFFNHPHEKYGCNFAKGIVRCDLDHDCQGYPKAKPQSAPPHYRVVPLPPPRPPAPQPWLWYEEQW